MLTVGTVFLVGVFVCEWYMQDQAMIPLRLFRNRTVAAMLARCFLMGIVFNSVLVYLPLYFQLVLVKTVTESAALILPLVISQSVASIASGQYMARKKRWGCILWVGWLLWMLGAGLVCAFSKQPKVVVVVCVLVIEGLGIGSIFQPIISGLQAHVSKRDRAVVISARNSIRALDGSAGMAASSIIFSNVLLHRLPASLPEQVRTEIHSSTFSRPDLSGLNVRLQEGVFDAYMAAARAVFVMFAPVVGVCLLFMVMVKDGLVRKDEMEDAEREQALSTDGRRVDERDASDKAVSSSDV